MELYFPFGNRKQLQGYTIHLYIMTEMLLVRDSKVWLQKMCQSQVQIFRVEWWQDSG